MFSRARAFLAKRFHAHWQNLSEDDRPGYDHLGAAGTIDDRNLPLHGRAWLHRRIPPGDSQTLAASLEWALGLREHLGLGFVVKDDYDETATFSVGTPLGALYLTFRVPAWLAARAGSGGADTSISIDADNGTVRWSLWMPLWEHSSRDPKWRRGYLPVVDRLLGAPEHSERILRVVDVELPLPEGGYPARAVLREQTWRRARWPIPRRQLSVSIDAPGGVPSSHKGPTYGMSMRARSIADGVGKFVGSILRDRAPNHPHAWRPTDRERLACLERAAERATKEQPNG